MRVWKVAKMKTFFFLLLKKSLQLESYNRIADWNPSRSGKRRRIDYSTFSFVTYVYT